MSILIKGMAMPKNCGECPFYYENKHDRGDDSLCLASGKEAKCGCPLIELPPHGDLIDRDALNNAFTGMRFNADGLLLHYGDRQDWYLKGSEVETLITNATTIIESEGEDG